MDNFDYKKYSLEKLETWISDALTSAEASPQEIYDTIHKVVKEEYHYHKHNTGRCYELLSLLNGHHEFEIDTSLDNIDASPKVCDKDDKSPECKKAWNDFWEENYYPEEYQQYTEEELNAMCDKAASEQDKVVKWQLPVEVDGLTGDCFIQFPDDLLEAANLKEGDLVQWIDRGDGSFELRKVTKPIGMEEC